MNGKYPGKYISILYRHANMFLSKQYSRFNIGSGQYKFMLYLYTHDCVIQDDLSTELCVDNATTTRAMKRLEEEGYVVRARDENDKRAMRVCLTEKALAIKKEFFEILDFWDAILTDNLTDNEKKTVVNIFEKMVCNTNKYFNKGE